MEQEKESKVGEEEKEQEEEKEVVEEQEEEEEGEGGGGGRQGGEGRQENSGGRSEGWRSRGVTALSGAGADGVRPQPGHFPTPPTPHPSTSQFLIICNGA